MRTVRFSLTGLPSAGPLPSSLRSRLPSRAPLTSSAEGPSNDISFVARGSLYIPQDQARPLCCQQKAQRTGILDVVHDAGYFEPHLTRWLKYLIGQTPMKISRRSCRFSKKKQSVLGRAKVRSRAYDAPLI